MKIQRKLLTEEQKKKLCEEYMVSDSKEEMAITICFKDCPLRITVGTNSYCINNIIKLEQIVKDYWNEEIEVEEKYEKKL